MPSKLRCLRGRTVDWSRSLYCSMTVTSLRSSRALSCWSPKSRSKNENSRSLAAELGWYKATRQAASESV